MNTQDFEKRFNSRKKLFNRIAFINVFTMIAMFFVLVFAIYYLLSNPEGIGEFIGKVLKGIKSAN